MVEFDYEIIKKIQNGEIGLFKELVEEYKDRAFSLTIKILKNREEAEDSLQEVFMKLYRAIMQKQFEARSKFSTYFYRIVYNTAVDFYKRNKNKKFNIVSIDVNESNYREGDELTRDFYEKNIDSNKFSVGRGFDPEGSISENEIQNIVNEYIDSIPEHYSVILNMYYLNELTHSEITEVLGIPIGTVKNRIFRAKEKLKDIILEKYSKEEILEYV